MAPTQQPPNAAESVLANIPFHYAGSKAEGIVDTSEIASMEGNNGYVTLDKKEYHLSSGYLVPHYELREHELSRRAERLVMDRVHRFFAMAEPNIDFLRTHADIMRAKEAYLDCEDPQKRDVKGRELAGMIVERMGRLAQVILQENIEGIDIEIEHEPGKYELRKEQIAACLVEFREFNNFLILDAQSPISFVRLYYKFPGTDSYAIDYDGFLVDLVREMGKALLMSEKMVYGGLIEKIGCAMGAIDETSAALKKLLENQKLSNALAAVHKHLYEGNAYPLVTHQPSYPEMLDELTALCRARAGIRRQDYENCSPVSERITYLDERLAEIHSTINDKISPLRGYYADLDNAQKLLRRGVQLMCDMAVSRYPRNYQAFPDMPKEEAQAKSSVGRFASMVDEWCISPAMMGAAS